MTRTNWAIGSWRSRLDARSPRDAEGQPTPALVPAVTLGAVAAVLLALGSSIPVVAGAAPGFTSMPLLVVLALAPMALVVVLILRGQAIVAAGVLAGIAALAPGRLTLDLEFFVDSSAASRPELYRPLVYALPGPAAGLWLLIAGWLVLACGGVFAVRAAGPRPERLPEQGEWRDAQPGSTSSEGRSVARSRSLTGLFGAVLAAVGVMMAPFSSADAFLPVGSAFERPIAVLVGCLLLAFALPVAAALAMTSGTPDMARGGLIGLAVGAGAFALPAFVSGLAVPGVSVAAGPIIVLIGAVFLLIAAVLPAEGGTAEQQATSGGSGSARLPGAQRMHAITGVLGLLTMATSLVGALTPQVEVAGGLPGPQSPWRWLLLIAGLLVGVLGVAMFVPRLAAAARPALSAGWAGVVVAATAVLTTATTASELGTGLETGPGAPWAAMAVVCAAATACCSVATGMVERDDSDEAADQVPGPNLVIPLLAGGILAFGAFGTPSIVSGQYTEAALWPSFGTPSWGLLIALVTVVGACLLAMRSRPARAAALLAGAAGVAALRVVALPLAAPSIPGAHAGVGWWLALGCALALALAAVTAITGKPARRRK